VIPPKAQVPDDELAEEGMRLIRAGFELARLSGRENWRRMTLAVLKNRLLSLTDRQFDEERWGAHSFREFVEMFPKILALDRSTQPATAEYLGEPASGPSTPRLGEPATAVPGAPMPRVVGADRRIRPDLWRAVLDYSSGAVYVWDGSRATAVAPSELRPGDQKRLLPTISEALLSEWRQSFVAGLTRLPSEAARDAITRWAEERLPDSVLPYDLRRQWNGELKQRLMLHLGEWSDRTGVSFPTGIVEAADQPSSEKVTTEKLREFVLEAVRAMSRHELEELRLPPAALLRRQP
jgi:hypothetical protein